MTEEEDYFGWTEASDVDDIPSMEDDFAQPSDLPPKDDDSQIEKLPDDLGLESSSQPESKDMNMNMLLKAAGWHPFLHQSNGYVYWESWRSSAPPRIRRSHNQTSALAGFVGADGLYKQSPDIY